MGMFDNIVCRYPLPDGAPTAGYQTKDTDRQALERYTIEADGQLLHEVVEYEDRSDPTAPPDSIQRLAGMMTPVHKGWEVVPFHGALNFYTSNVSGSGPNGYLTDDDKRAEFWDFTALYDHGKLLKMEGGREDKSDDPFWNRDPCSREEFWKVGPPQEAPQ